MTKKISNSTSSREESCGRRNEIVNKWKWIRISRIIGHFRYLAWRHNWKVRSSWEDAAAQFYCRNYHLDMTLFVRKCMKRFKQPCTKQTTWPSSRTHKTVLHRWSIFQRLFQQLNYTLKPEPSTPFSLSLNPPSSRLQGAQTPSKNLPVWQWAN